MSTHILLLQSILFLIYFFILKNGKAIIILSHTKNVLAHFPYSPCWTGGTFRPHRLSTFPLNDTSKHLQNVHPEGTPHNNGVLLPREAALSTIVDHTTIGCLAASLPTHPPPPFSASPIQYSSPPTPNTSSSSSAIVLDAFAGINRPAAKYIITRPPAESPRPLCPQQFWQRHGNYPIDQHSYYLVFYYLASTKAPDDQHVFLPFGSLGHPLSVLHCLVYSFCFSLRSHFFPFCLFFGSLAITHLLFFSIIFPSHISASFFPWVSSFLLFFSSSEDILTVVCFREFVLRFLSFVVPGSVFVDVLHRRHLHIRHCQHCQARPYGSIPSSWIFPAPSRPPWHPCPSAPGRQTTKESRHRLPSHRRLILATVLKLRALPSHPHRATRSATVVPTLSIAAPGIHLRGSLRLSPMDARVLRSSRLIRSFSLWPQTASRKARALSGRDISEPTVPRLSVSVNRTELVEVCPRRSTPRPSRDRRLVLVWMPCPHSCHRAPALARSVPLIVLSIPVTRSVPPFPLARSFA